MQSRLHSLVESIANAAAGLVLSFFLQLVLFDLLGIAASLGQNLLLTAAFSGLSLLRSYILRRFFNGVLHKPRTVQQPHSAGSSS